MNPKRFYFIFSFLLCCFLAPNLQAQCNSNFQITSSTRGCPTNEIGISFWQGRAPYTCYWSTGDTSIFTIYNNYYSISSPGTYMVTVVDANGCTASDTIQVDSISPIQVSYAITDASCGQEDGAIDLTVSGGDGNYRYVWSELPVPYDEYQEDQTHLGTGYYKVSIRDGGYCYFYDDSIYVPGPGRVDVNFDLDNLANCDDRLGELHLNPSGFNQPQYIWNTGDTTASIVNLSSGLYTVTITDGGCQFSRNIYLHQHPDCARILSGRVQDNTILSPCDNGRPLTNRLVRLNPQNIITKTNERGYYVFPLKQSGTFTVELIPDDESNQVCQSGPLSAYTHFYGSTYPHGYGLICPDGSDFKVTYPQGIDLRAEINHYSLASPNATFYTYAHYCNDGSITQNATLTLAYDSLLQFNHTDSLPAYSNGTGSNYQQAQLLSHDSIQHQLVFELPNLEAKDCGLILLEFEVPANLPLGQRLGNSLSISPSTRDQTPHNNQAIDSFVVDSSAPQYGIILNNARSGNPLGQAEIFEQDEWLDYTIYFEAEGRYPAYGFVIKDTLDPSFDLTSLKNIRSSHPVYLEIESNGAVTFSRINVPTKQNYSRGFVSFSVKRDPNLPVGSIIPHQAFVLPGRKGPVPTNLSEAMILSNPLSNHQLELLNTNFKVFPNPSQGQYFVNFEQSQTQDLHLQVYNMQGQLLIEQTQADAPTSGQMSFDLSNFPAAHYLLRINGQDQLIQKQ